MGALRSTSMSMGQMLELRKEVLLAWTMMAYQLSMRASCQCSSAVHERVELNCSVGENGNDRPVGACKGWGDLITCTRLPVRGGPLESAMTKGSTYLSSFESSGIVFFCRLRGATVNVLHKFIGSIFTDMMPVPFPG